MIYSKLIGNHKSEPFGRFEVFKFWIKFVANHTWLNDPVLFLGHKFDPIISMKFALRIENFVNKLFNDIIISILDFLDSFL